MITLLKGDSLEQRNVEISNDDDGLRVWYLENRRQIVFRKYGGRVVLQEKVFSVICETEVWRTGQDTGAGGKKAQEIGGGGPGNPQLC